LVAGKFEDTAMQPLNIFARATALLLLALAANTGIAQTDVPYARVSIAHGGASEHLPFSSLSAFKAAVEMRPDYIETDVQMTSDGVLVCFHDLVLENRTNVRTLFPDRYTEIEVNGKTVKTWYVNDFTLSEIKTLDYGSWFSPEFSQERIVTFQELIDLSKGKVGLYPESKDPDFYHARGLDLDLALHEIFVRNNLHTPQGQVDTPIIIQSFDEASLQYLRELNGPNYALIQLVWTGQSYDYLSDEGLRHIATYADGVAPLLSMVLPPNADRVAAAHDNGLYVHIWHSSTGFPEPGYTSNSYMSYLMDILKIDGLMIHEPDQFPVK